MAGVPPKTLHWLYDVLKREYRDANRTYSDAAQTLAQYPGLAPRTDVYTSENGVPALLLNLKGTLPVNFRGTTYQFPITIWIPHAYPHEAPMIYVMPTDDMVVRPGQHVSASDGKIYHHYLARWADTWDRSNVVEFLSILAEVFSKEPPVMAKVQQAQSRQQSSAQPSQSATSSGGGPPVPPLRPLHNQARYNSQSSLPGSPRTASLSHTGPPPPPPPPKPAADLSRPGSSNTPIQTPKPSRYNAPLPLPNSEKPAPPLPHQTPYGNGGTQYSASGATQFTPQRSSSLRQQYPPQEQSPSFPQQYLPQSSRQSVTEQQLSRPPQLPASDRGTDQNHPGPQNYNQNQLHHVQRNSAVQPVVSPDLQLGRNQNPHNAPMNNQPLSSPVSNPLNQQHFPQPQQIPPQQSQYQQYHTQPGPLPNHPYPRPQIQQAIPQSKTALPKDLLSDNDPFQISLLTTSQSNLPAPPIPTNPEKTALLSHLSRLILECLHNSIEQTQSSALPSLQSQQVALTSASQTLKSEMHQLQILSQQLQSNISAVQSTINNANNTIKSTQDPKHPSHADNIPVIDQIIIPPTVVARQLYEAVAEQRGYEAAILALNDAFVRGRIGAELWGRKMRECAREEMRRKWLVKKIGEGLGLDEP